jgi:catechol 2,3-dioxygenase-like lactoylglutathione lyase family enzyme
MILGFAHPAIVVPDLDKACEFYEQMFGFRPFAEEGWQDSEAADRAVGLRGSSCRGRTLAGHNCYLELFEYGEPEQAGPDPASLGAHEPGIRHLAFFVDDVRAEYARLKRLGGEALGEPTEIADGIYAVYCRDPFGNIIELCDIPTAEEDPRNLPGVDSLSDYEGH